MDETLGFEGENMRTLLLECLLLDESRLKAEMRSFKSSWSLMR
eukprot:05461.XXX_102355_102483_1 [CDS] Oithona nana genome sequencing.